MIHVEQNTFLWKVTALLFVLKMIASASASTKWCPYHHEHEYKVVVSPAADSATVGLDVKRVNDDGTERMRLRKRDFFDLVPNQVVRECVSVDECFYTKFTRGEGTYRVYLNGE